MEASWERVFRARYGGCAGTADVAGETKGAGASE
jgi:hypothetical protein